ncbi:hypothetical protein HMSSN036_06010 [Paenibacillus macerans]|nr:hypothetical protein HMSSN036_06010 [Paenibacillus macerans]
MTEYLIRRLLQSVLVIFLITVVTFLLIHAAPGGPTQMMLAPGMSPETFEQQKRNLGLDQPIPVQYVRWVGTCCGATSVIRLKIICRSGICCGRGSPTH